MIKFLETFCESNHLCLFNKPNLIKYFTTSQPSETLGSDLDIDIAAKYYFQQHDPNKEVHHDHVVMTVGVSVDGGDYICVNVVR